ncbi:MAG: TIGR02206 family membrane protein [Candidatus Neomarinimicrobiota bacterium]
MDNQTPFEYTPFELFGDIHLITLGIILSVSLIFSFTVRQYYDKNTFAGFEKILGYLLIITELIKPFFLVEFGDYHFTNTVPLHLCHITSYATGLFLLTRDTRFFDFAYFWGMGGGTMALLTPDVEFTFPHIDFISLFSSHGLVFFTIIYILVVIRQYVTFSSLINAVKYALMALPFVYVLNLIIGGEEGYKANLWYLMERSEGASLMDFFPVFFQNPPFHMLIVIPLSIVIFLFLYLPFYLFEKK